MRNRIPAAIQCMLLVMAITGLQIADAARRGISPVLINTRAEFGQYMTPAPVASLMAGFFRTRRDCVRILDPGAGVGSLTAALLERLLARKTPPREIAVTCYEIDGRLFGRLWGVLEACRRRCRSCGVSLSFDIRREDYIEATISARRLAGGDGDSAYDCVIMNPPYRKINSASRTRLLLRSEGIETSNLYSAFMLLAARELAPGGEFVSISPRSFCNGPYFRTFRRELMALLDIRQIHVFESRTDAFREDAVLQENVILHGLRSTRQRHAVYVSLTAPDGRTRCRRIQWEQVVRPGDREAVIHVASDPDADQVARKLGGLSGSLISLGLRVSTGRVVDFRAKEHLRARPTPHTAPLIYSSHFRGAHIVWPNRKSRKPNAILPSQATAHLLVPAGFYVLTKRFSAKEERRRLVAAIYDPRTISGERVGFDNKLNYFHRDGTAMSLDEARGLAVYLNSTVVDRYFRLFSGHTQVNAADLRRMPYPTEAELLHLGAKVRDLADQNCIDRAVESLF